MREHRNPLPTLTMYNRAAVAKARMPANSAGVAASTLAISEPMTPPIMMVQGKTKMMGRAIHRGYAGRREGGRERERVRERAK